MAAMHKFDFANSAAFTWAEMDGRRQECCATVNQGPDSSGSYMSYTASRRMTSLAPGRPPIEWRTAWPIELHGPGRGPEHQRGAQGADSNVRDGNRHVHGRGRCGRRNAGAHRRSERGGRGSRRVAAGGYRVRQGPFVCDTEFRPRLELVTGRRGPRFFRRAARPFAQFEEGRL